MVLRLLKNLLQGLVFPASILILAPMGVWTLNKDKLRSVPTMSGSQINPEVHEYFLTTSIGPYLDVVADPPLEEMLNDPSASFGRQSRQTPKEVKAGIDYVKYTFELDQNPVDSASKRHYIGIAKNPNNYKKDTKLGLYELLKEEKWLFSYKGTPVSITCTCILMLPFLVASLLQLWMNQCRRKEQRELWQSFVFPVVPVLVLQQTRREYFLRKKTVRRFCIQWEVGRINIRMNTRLVDLRQILHPRKRHKKVHRYTTWRIIRLIVRFNAYLAMKRNHVDRTEVMHLKNLLNRVKTWKKRISNSHYLAEKKHYDNIDDTSSINPSSVTLHAPTPNLLRPQNIKQQPS